MYKTAENKFNTWINPNYGGISNTGDYEYLVSSLGYAGYDSLITEKNWQDFAAYEYSVLMDVADYIWKGQEDLPDNAYDDTVYGPHDAAWYNDERYYEESEIPDSAKGPTYMPYLPVTQEYDCSKLTHEQWLLLVNSGQNSARFVDDATRNAIAGANKEFSTSSIILGRK